MVLYKVDPEPKKEDEIPKDKKPNVNYNRFIELSTKIFKNRTPDKESKEKIVFESYQ